MSHAWRGHCCCCTYGFLEQNWKIVGVCYLIVKIGIQYGPQSKKSNIFFVVTLLHNNKDCTLQIIFTLEPKYPSKHVGLALATYTTKTIQAKIHLKYILSLPKRIINKWMNEEHPKRKRKWETIAQDFRFFIVVSNVKIHGNLSSFDSIRAKCWWWRIFIVVFVAFFLLYFASEKKTTNLTWAAW